MTAENLARLIVEELRAAGHQAFLVGGCVRDLLLRRQPADYDIATDALPQQVMQLFPETFAIGVQFGVVLVPLPSGNGEDARDQSGFGHHGSVEVATFRSDLGYSDGRHPDEVKFSKSPQIDVQRRDFTIPGSRLVSVIITFVRYQPWPDHVSVSSPDQSMTGPR